jgi:dTDP-4-dehydrorhamnose 3,5-epimerase
VRVKSTDLPDVLLIEPRLFKDERGHLLEIYQAERYLEHGIPAKFVQDNLSYSAGNVLRGLHYQLGQPQGKLVSVVQGRIFDVVVDLRKNSPNFGQWISITLDARDFRQLYLPQGFAHGFCVISDSATVLYKCTDYYAPHEERGIRWDDPFLGINWPVAKPILSPKDQAYPGLESLPASELPA